MSTAAPSPPKKPKADKDRRDFTNGLLGDWNPDVYRMSVGDHLEELRSRLFKALIGGGLAFVVCLLFVKDVVLPIVAGPLIEALLAQDLPPQMFFTDVTDPFFVYLQVSTIGAIVIGSPWILWQAWQFVAAGLYGYERKAVTRYLPLSIMLFFGGVAFVYWLVLPWTLSFFLGFSITIPLPEVASSKVVATTADQVATVPAIAGDPAEPVPYQWWYDTTTQRLKMRLAGQTRVIPFGSQNLTTPIITLPQYVDLVLNLLLTFAGSFQLPLVIMALIRIRVVTADLLKKQRRYVYFILVVLATMLTPGDLITASIALVVPLGLLFEFGIWLGEYELRRAGPLTDDGER